MLIQFFKELNLDLDRFASKSRIKSKVFALLTVQGAWAVFVYRFGNISYQKSKKNKLYLFNIFIWYILNKILEIVAGISIDYRATIGGRLLISHFGNIFVSAKVVLGDNCNLSQGVTIGHGSGGYPIIENNVYIGAGAIINGNINIGENSKIGSLASVVKSFPKNSIIVGNPAVNKATNG
jgi:serine O-acetyltransferase